MEESKSKYIKSESTRQHLMTTSADHPKNGGGVWADYFKVTISF